jgi:hypothetical protein
MGRIIQSVTSQFHLNHHNPLITLNYRVTLPFLTPPRPSLSGCQTHHGTNQLHSATASTNPASPSLAIPPGNLTHAPAAFTATVWPLDVSRLSWQDALRSETCTLRVVLWVIALLKVCCVRLVMSLQRGGGGRLREEREGEERLGKVVGEGGDGNKKQ